MNNICTKSITKVLYRVNVIKKWLHKFGRCGKWNFCLTAGTLVLANQEQQ